MLSVGESPGYSWSIHLHFGEYLLAIYFLAFVRDSTRAFFQIQGIFHYFRAFKTEIIHIYLLIGQILKQLSPSVSMTGSHLHFGDNC